MLRDRFNLQLTSHFENAYGYPAVIFPLTWTERELMPDGVHLTDRDYMEVATQINLHLDTYVGRLASISHI